MILEAFRSIVDFFSSIYNFILDFFRDTIYVIQLTAQFVARIPDYFSWLPTEAVVLIVAIFSVVVIYKVLGREG